MSKIAPIFKREYSTRVRKRSFLLLTIIGPILMASVGILPIYLASLPEEARSVLVLDKANVLRGQRGNDEVQLRYLGPSEKFELEEAKKLFLQTEEYALLYIPTGSEGDPDFIAQRVQLFGRDDVSLAVKEYLEDAIRESIESDKLRAQGVDPALIALTKTQVEIHSFNLGEDGKQEQSAVELKMAISFLSAVLMYIFIFLFGAQVMTGVLEEKGSRVVEVLISSVKPFELMLGKILGIGAVGLTQFAIWIVLTTLIYIGFTSLFLGDRLEALRAAQEAGQTLDQGGMQALVQMVESLNFPLLLGGFLFFFVAGYLFYAALFAAVGAAVDNPGDTQQFMMPITIPIIAAFAVSTQVIEHPDGALAFWFSMIPFTSPIVMMTRLVFGVPAWELGLSMALLVLGFLSTTWIAGKIYRSGILLYGKKASWGDLWRWIRN